MIPPDPEPLCSRLFYLARTLAEPWVKVPREDSASGSGLAVGHGSGDESGGSRLTFSKRDSIFEKVDTGRFCFTRARGLPPPARISPMLY